MNNRANPAFWRCLNELPDKIQRQAEKCFALFKNDAKHPSLHFKKVGKFWSVRIGLHYRALAVEDKDDLVWFWIGIHDEYDKLIATQQ